MTGYTIHGQKIAGGKVHVCRRLSESPGWMVIACTGRAMSGMVATSEPVTCKACPKKEAS